MAPPSIKTDNYTNNVDDAARVFAEYGNFIRTAIRYRIKNESQADDLFQDFFLCLVARPVPEDVRNIKGYLYRRITCEIINAICRVERYQIRILKYTERTNRFIINKQNPEDALIEAEEAKKMFELIEMQLRHSEAQVITLRYRHSYSIKEIAKKINVDNASVRKYISVGFSKLRQFLTNSKTMY